MKTSMNASVVNGSRVVRLMLTGLAFSVLMLMAVPLYGVSPINLHAPHVNTNSADLAPGTDTGGLMDPVVWHFVLTGSWGSPSDMQLSVVFQDAGPKTVGGHQAGGGAIHFFVGTPAHDVLLSGQATLLYESAPQNTNLVLSHIALNEPPGEEPPGEEPPGEEPPGEEPPGEEPPGEEPPGEEPPGEEPPGEEPPGEEPPGEEPPGEEPPGEEPPVTEEDEPFLPFTEEEAEVLVEKAEEEEFLPFTGGPITLLLGSAAAALAGATLRRLGR